jgi:hypothetical protein
MRSKRHNPGSAPPASVDSQHPPQPASVEADDDLIVDRDDRDRHPACSRDQLVASLGVLRDVLCREGDAVGRKKLLRRVTRLSR